MVRLHRHHIIPRHAGGTDDEDNIAVLTVAEHADAHHLLWCLHKDKYDYIAWKCLSGQITMSEAKYQASLEALDRGRRSRKGKPKSAQARARMSAAKKGRSLPWLDEYRSRPYTREKRLHFAKKRYDIFDYETDELIAENVQLKIWAEENGFDDANLYRTANGKQKQIKGVYARRREV